MTLAKYTKGFILSCLYMALPCAQRVQAAPPGNDACDSLSAIYVSVKPAGGRYIVDQGLKKALFGKDGRPLTPFDYKDIIPGADGRYVGVLENVSVLLDREGHTLLRFPEVINRVDTVRKLYKAVYYDGVTAIYDGAGRRLQDRYYEKDEYRTGFYRFSNNGGRQGVKDTLGHVILPIAYDRGLSVSSSGLAGLSGDTLYAFDTKGKLRFKTWATGVVMLDHGVVGIKRYGLWGLLDSTGKPLTPVKYNKLEKVLSGDFIETDGAVLDHKGHEVMNKFYNDVFAVAGWYEVSAPNVLGYEIRDERFKLVIDPKQYERTDFLGNRFIEVFKDYNDREGRLYDRKTRAFSNLRIDTLLDMDTYLLKTRGTTGRKVLKGDRMIGLPYFATIIHLEERPYWLIGRDAAPEPEAPQEDDYTSLRSVRLPGDHLGLLDSSLRLVLPMKYSGINVLANGMIVAIRNAAPRTSLFNAKGKLIHTYDEAADIHLEDGILQVGLQKEFLLMDTAGAVFFRSRNQPSFLYPSMTEADNERHTSLFLCSDSTGFSALYNRQGKKLLPALYYLVVQKTAGLHSLKKDDSIYYVNNQGKLLYGGRGFNDDDYYILESYAMLLRDSHGKWGVIASDGSIVQPFIYDTAGLDRTVALGYFVSRDGQYALLDNLGRLRYPLQPWFPTGKFPGDYYQDKALRYYKLENGNLVPLAQLPYEMRYSMLGMESSYFAEIRDLDKTGLPSGIYNRRLQRIAPVYAGFGYNKFYDRILITDSLQKNISVIDTNGNPQMPFIPKPALVVVNHENIVAISDDGNDRLFYKEGGKDRVLPIKVDSAVRAELLRQTRQYASNYTNDKTIAFSTASGAKGLAPRIGPALADSLVTEIREMEYYHLIGRNGKWGLMKDGAYIQPPVADSILYKDKDRTFIIYKDHKRGAYYPATDKYVAPRYDAILEPTSLQNGFLLVKQDGYFKIIDDKGRQLTPELDSIGRASPYLSDIIAYRQGAEASVSVDGDGNLQLHLSRNIRRSGINGYYGDLVIIKENDLYGLYSNRFTRMVLPPIYDAIDRLDKGDFLVAWKYKADKHEGMDSTIVVSADGNMLFRFKGWVNPGAGEKGYLNLDHAGVVNISNSEGKTIVPAGYRIITFLENTLFLVGKDDKTGIVDTSGAWTLRPVDDAIDYTSFSSSGYLTGRVVSNSGTRAQRVRYYLIDKRGRRVDGLYDSIEFMDDGKIKCRSGNKITYIESWLQ